ncbi:MAG TPA: hypothetical protein VFT82_01330 [Candidatus Paceibacterota bacterium]|nr:hypothetical protein [Candidatus Paceibacterota bacterium]
MNEFDQNKLDALLDQKAFAEARAYVESYFRQSSGPQEKAASATDIGLLYLKMVNKINRRYLESLKSTADLLEKVQAAKSRVNDAFKVAKLKSEVGGAQ